jgi:hypothetical protein
LLQLFCFDRELSTSILLVHDVGHEHEHGERKREECISIQLEDAFTEPGRNRQDERDDSEECDETRTRSLEGGQSGRSIPPCSESKWAQTGTLAQKRDELQRDRSKKVLARARSAWI